MKRGKDNEKQPINKEVNLPYEKREDVPEQAKELWDVMHS
jgi:hypothetical protein